jgi:hypothetical protein
MTQNIIVRCKRWTSFVLVLALLVSVSSCSFVKDTASTVANGARNAADSVSSGVAELFKKITTPKDAEQFEEVLDGITTQNISAFVAELKANVDFETLLVKLQTLKTMRTEQISSENIKLVKIAEQIDDARTFISDPEHIMGNEITKSGEIAERLDVAARNIERITDGLEPNATFDGVGRTAAADYLVDGKPVQAKFYQNPRLTLNAVIENSNGYNWGQNEEYFVVPKEQFEALQKIRNGERSVELNGWNPRGTTIESIYDDIIALEEKTGSSFDDLIKPAKVSYDDVQTKVALDTLEDLDNSSSAKIDAAKTKITQEAEISKKTAISECIKNDFVKVGQAAVIGLGIGAFISVGFSIYEKVSDGKSIENFTDDDWKEIGIDAIMSGLQGAGVGAATELLCIFGMPAPIAGAIIATVFQTMVLYISYSKGEITLDELLSGSLESCITSSLLASGAIIGQMVIPVPIVGAIVGSVATGIIIAVVRTYASSIDQIEQRTEEFADNFSKEYNTLLENTTKYLNSAVDATQETLTTSYVGTKNCITDAVTFAVEKVSK